MLMVTTTVGMFNRLHKKQKVIVTNNNRNVHLRSHRPEMFLPTINGIKSAVL